MTVCVFCEEEVLPEEQAPSMAQPAHANCLLRQVIGSVGHQLGTCSCFGGTEEDPPGLTKRQAAKAAAELFRRRVAHGLVSGVPPVGGKDC